MDLRNRFIAVRDYTHQLGLPVQTEDMLLQTMPDVSPMRWHLAHTTWFFDTFVLDGKTREPGWDFLFNSYYNGAGPQFPRDKRGTQSRPTVAQITQWRRRVDAAVLESLDDPSTHALVEVGTHHEQQHQELMLTDLKHVLFSNPLGPAYRSEGHPPSATVKPAQWLTFDGQVTHIGHNQDRFAFDNESPRHRVFVEPFEIMSRPVSNREFLEFVEDDGYRRAELWFAEGWTTVQTAPWTQPLYWRKEDAGWQEWTLAGWQPLDLDAPVSHISLFEADAYAHWSKARLPTEFEWELALGGAVASQPPRLRPGATQNAFGVGDVWEWTSSAFGPYPGFKPWDGTLGEYNGKFMVNQYVLRGGSCVTPADHIRGTYRNFFPAHARWQFTGVRLARSEV
ncbi:MAG: ergothioneine biosynthesis protein EgtB [bacterium]